MNSELKAIITKAIILLMLSSIASTANAEWNLFGKKQPTVETVSAEAEISALFTVSAARSCSIIGITSMLECERNHGRLTAEMIAANEAKLAREYSFNYSKNCNLTFGEEFCRNLLSRAIAIEWRKPVSTDN